MRYLFNCFFVLGMLALGITTARGQGFPTGSRGNTGGGSQKGPLQLDREELDTFPVQYVFSKDFARKYAFADSLLDDFFHQYDPVRQRIQDYKNLGVPGSAHQALVYAPRLRRGFDPGFHQYDLYLREAHQLPFYILQRAFTNLGFSRGSEQSNTNFSAQFSRNFSNKLNFSLDYQRVAQLGTPALFPNQQGRNTALGVGFWAQSKNGRYQAFAVYADNKLEHDENGGIVAEPSRTGAFFTPTATSVYLTSAGSRHRHQEIQYTHYYRLGASDSIAAALDKGNTFQLGHQMRYKSSAYKFFDPSPARDSSFYGVFQTDNRGIRFFLQHNKLENQFRLMRVASHGDVPRSIELNLTHVLHQIRQEPLDSSLQEVFIGGRWKANPLSALELDVEANLGVLGSAGDYQVLGEAALALGTWGTFRAGLTNQLYQPTLIQHQFFVTQTQVWQNDFRKTLETNLRASLLLPKWHLELGGAYHLLNQVIYFDTAGFARQTGAVQAVGQLMIRKEIHVGKIHLENQLTFQAITGTVLRFPTWFGKHSLYFSGKMFSVLDVRVGVDVRYASDYFSDAYFPLTGQFHLQDKEELLLFPAVDAYFNMKVTRFRAFVKVENISGAFLNGRLFYQVPNYPWPPVSGFRLGIKWRLSE